MEIIIWIFLLSIIIGVLIIKVKEKELEVTLTNLEEPNEIITISAYRQKKIGIKNSIKLPSGRYKICPPEKYLVIGTDVFDTGESRLITMTDGNKRIFVAISK